MVRMLHGKLRIQMFINAINNLNCSIFTMQHPTAQRANDLQLYAALNIYLRSIKVVRKKPDIEEYLLHDSFHRK